MRTIATGLLAALLLSTPATAADCPKLPEGMRCMAEAGDGPSMYLVGRQAYDTARETGDFTEARMWAVKAMEAKFFPAAKMLYKMVHLQIGDGAHKDMVEGHVWLAEAVDGGADYLKPWMKRLEARMTRKQIAEARTCWAEK